MKNIDLIWRIPAAIALLIVAVSFGLFLMASDFMAASFNWMKNDH